MENLRGAAMMVAAMAAFAIEDMFIKRLSVDISTGQILMMLGAGGALVFGLLASRRGARLFSPVLLTRPVLLRNLGEVIGTMGFVTAIALTPLSSASAILQATPLAVTLGAAVFMQEAVGWRRWSAILVGFAGVLLIIRPGLEGFEPASLFAVQGVIGLAIRDLATRAVPREIGAMQLSAYAFGLLVPTGLVLLLVQGHSLTTPLPAQWGQFAGALVLGIVGYYSIVAAMRLGEVAVVTPFRYSRLIFAIIIGVTVFGERPDSLTLTGAALIVGSGLYTLLREARLHRRARRAAR
ncbi:DMT family transporter [Lutimaribacter saemankumensis]|uniref:Permease of the drug/metabolite transporter (DMT) superfamily n=1 Tax=Lutimaribacter saemankumensis TaxID=490829 RepID=A0A1G8HEA2_9RHOB|nr:DMT family transporter [Lutimaribacter saemankumensis]SDI05017.1 Permease of the drug/metabolite transporter (DMT) superfamily [Lutimaribacter saemankumensis]